MFSRELAGQIALLHTKSSLILFPYFVYPLYEVDGAQFSTEAAMSESTVLRATWRSRSVFCPYARWLRCEACILSAYL